MILKLINSILRPAGLTLTKNKPALEPDFAADEAFVKLYSQVSDYSMASAERMHALHEAVKYSVSSGLPGSFVECGVWKGGSSMMIALTLKSLGITNRDLYLYDTFEGMSDPTEDDKAIDGNKAADLLANESKTANVWAYSALEEVKSNMARTGYPTERIHYVKGKVEDTIPGTMPESIAILRLDTDWYESTRHELEHLYPLLVSRGVLIIDDFGHWQGAKKAVLEYFGAMAQPPLMSRIDYTGRMLVKF